MTAKQESLYWREWQAVRVACKKANLSEPDRHALHSKALGQDMSHLAFSNVDFDLVLAEFRAVSNPAGVGAQLRQQAQPRARELHKIAELMICLELYHPDPLGYIREIIRDKFNRGSTRQVSEITELSSEPRIFTNRRTGRTVEGPSQVRQLIMTLERGLNGRNGFRARAGDSGHAMLTKAGLKCGCAECIPK